MARHKPDVIALLVKFFNGNTAKHSIYLEMPGRAEDAKAFFEIRSALGMNGWLDDKEAETAMRKTLGDALKRF